MGGKCWVASKGELVSLLHALHFGGQEEMNHLIDTQPQRTTFCKKGASSKWAWSTPPMAIAEREMQENVLGSDCHIKEMCCEVALYSTLQRKHWCPMERA